MWQNAIPQNNAIGFSFQADHPNVQFNNGNWTDQNGANIGNATPVQFVDFSAPHILGGNGTITQSIDPVTQWTDNGFSLTGLDYAVTANGLAPILLEWTASRTLPIDFIDGIVNIFWQTDVTMTGGNVNFDVAGFLSGINRVEFQKNIGVSSPVSWNEKSDVIHGVNGVRELRMRGQVLWTPGAIGETLRVTSLYDIQTVPEPSTIALMALGMVGLVRRLRSAKAV